MKFWLCTLSLLLSFFALQAKTQLIFNADYEYLNISPSPSFHKSDVLKKLYSKSNQKEEKFGSDNPLDHGATFFTFKTKTFVTEGVEVFADILAEHRGASYGNRTADNMIVYPQIFLEINKELYNGLQFASHFGDKQGFKLNQGLYIYNINTRSIEQTFYVGDRFSYKFLWIADMVKSVGLNTDDFFANSCAYTFGQDSSGWKSEVSAALGLCLGDMDASENRAKNTWSAGGTLSYEQLWDGYLSLGTRDGASRAGACLLGTNFAKNDWQREIGLNFEARYYEVNFLDGLKNNVDFRDVNEDKKANTIGDELFPLTTYDDPFSQFAVFSEYQGSGEFDGVTKNLATDVWGVSLRTNWLERFYDFFLSLDCDLNYIKPMELAGTFYPFYSLKFGYEPFKNNKIAVVMSNKGMNLNKSYTTFYAYKQPYFGLSFSRDLDFN